MKNQMKKPIAQILDRDTPTLSVRSTRMRYCTITLPPEYVGRREVSVASNGGHGIGTLLVERTRKPRHESPSIKCFSGATASLGRKLYQLEFPLLNSFTGRDRCSGLAFACSTIFWTRGFCLVSMVSIDPGIWFDRVEKGGASESIEPGKATKDKGFR